MFHADKRGENEHAAGELFRQGARVAFGNEVSSSPWSNAVFKNKNSTDPLPLRACGSNEVRKGKPTYTFVFATNDPPSWEQEPKGSERDRLVILYLPNRFVDDPDAAGSPRRLPKDLSLERTIEGPDFATGHLLNLMQIRLERGLPKSPRSVRCALDGTLVRSSRGSECVAL